MSSIFDMYIEEAYGITSDYSLDDLFVESTVFITESVKDIINRIKESLVKMIDRVNGWLSKKPDSKIKSMLTNLLNKMKTALTKTKNYKEGDDINEVKDSYNEVKKEYDEVKKEVPKYKDIPGFEPSNFLKRMMNREPRDMYDIVGALIGYINADPGWKDKTDTFDQAVEWVLANGVSESELFEPYQTLNFSSSIKRSNGAITDDKSKWDDKYYALQLVYLKDNFSKKRIEHCREVGQYVYGTK